MSDGYVSEEEGGVRKDWNGAQLLERSYEHKIEEQPDALFGEIFSIPVCPANHQPGAGNPYSFPIGVMIVQPIRVAFTID